MVGTDVAEREILGLIVEFRGHTCAGTGSLQEAAGMLRKGFFDLVIAERGALAPCPQLVHELKNGYPELAFVVLAASGEKSEAGDETVALPCSPEKLISGIDRALGKLIGIRAKLKKEKRRFVRSVVELPCWIRDTRTMGPQIAGRTADLSRGGAYVVASGEWKVGTPVECLIRLTSKTLGAGTQGIRAEGKLMRIVADTPGVTGLGIAIDRHEFVKI
jgi:hypothetical protein